MASSDLSKKSKNSQFVREEKLRNLMIGITTGFGLAIVIMILPFSYSCYVLDVIYVSGTILVGMKDIPGKEAQNEK